MNPRQERKWELLGKLTALFEEGGQKSEPSTIARLALDSLTEMVEAERGSIYLTKPDSSPSRTDIEGALDPEPASGDPAQQAPTAGSEGGQSLYLAAAEGSPSLPQWLQLPINFAHFDATTPQAHPLKAPSFQKSRASALPIRISKSNSFQDSLLLRAAKNLGPLFIADVKDFNRRHRLPFREPLAASHLPVLGDSCILLPLYDQTPDKIAAEHCLGCVSLSAIQSFPNPDSDLRSALTLGAQLLASALTSRQRVQALQQRATRDGLTQLYNYSTFYDLLRREVQRADRYRAPLSVILIDLDKLKDINDKYGHLAGDRILAELALRIQSALRIPDLPARYAGDEFAVILPQTPKDGAIAVAERIRENITARPFTLDGLPPRQSTRSSIHCTVSLGIAEWSTGLGSVDLVSQADSQLYKAKRDGRDCVKA